MVNITIFLIVAGKGLHLAKLMSTPGAHTHSIGGQYRWYNWYAIKHFTSGRDFDDTSLLW